ncbi:MAG: hypothetical protein WA691_02885 [Thermoplasmata archaeon]
MTSVRALAWLVLGLVMVPLATPLAAAGPPVSYGKTIAPGVFGVPYADSTQPDFPNSYPAFGSGPLNDHQFVYDTQIGFEIVNPNPAPASFVVVTEEYTAGTTTVLRNVTQPNGSVGLEPMSVPARLDPTWSNATVAGGPFSSGYVEIPLAYASSERSLLVTVGDASWTFSYLTPATSSVAGLYTSAGIWAFAALIALVTFVALLAGLVAAGKLAARIGRSPPVPRWWPILWVAVPILWFMTGYVSFNQVLGAASPAFLPAPLVIAAFPYLPRLFTRYFDIVEIEGIEPLTLDTAANPKVVLPLVRHQGGLKCAAQAWREALWSHWVGLPEVRGYELRLLGGKVRVQPRLIAVSCPLDGYYQSDVTASCWYDARAGIKRLCHHIEWTRTESVPVLAPDGANPTGTRSKRRFSPHIAAGYLEASFPPKRPVANELAGVRSAEVEAHDNEIDRIENAELRGTLRHLSRTYAKDAVAAHEEAAQRQDRPRTREEIARLVQRNRNAREAPSNDGEPRSGED